MTIQHIDGIKFPPTLKGPHGCAWQCDPKALRERKNWPEEKDAQVAAWVILAPWAHMLWPYYFLAAVHLRPLPDTKPSTILLPGATHEVFLAALDPTVEPDLVEPMKSHLTPYNFCGQWVSQERPNPVDLDRAAALKIRGCVEDIIHGRLSPDTDFIAHWIERFSDSNIKR